MRIHCDFCGREQFETERMVAGPLVFICSDCIENCADILADGPVGRWSRECGIAEYDSWIANP